jgi:hypothetical protein
MPCQITSSVDYSRNNTNPVSSEVSEAASSDCNIKLREGMYCTKRVEENNCYPAIDVESSSPGRELEHTTIPLLRI